MTRTNPPNEQESEEADSSADGERTIGGVLLAAGKGERFEAGNKLLATLEDEPLVRRSARTLLEADLDDVVVVVGYDADAVRDALAGLDLRFEYNEDFADGQSTSVGAGVRVAREAGWDAAVFALGDMPFVAPATIHAVLETYVAGTATIVAPTYDGTRGNPVLFDATHFDALSDVTGDRGGRRLIERHDDTAFVEVDDHGIVRDVDYEADLE